MNPIGRLISRARRRMNLAGLIASLPAWLIAGMTVAAMGWLVPKLFPLPQLSSDSAESSWQLVWLAGSLAGATLLALVWQFRHRVDNDRAALEIDRRFGLRERISSAAALPPTAADEAAAQCLIADATARSARIDLRDQFGFPPSRWMAWLLAPALALAAVWLLPRAETKTVVPVQPVSNLKPEIRTAIEQAKKQLGEKKKKLSELGLEDMAGEMDSLGRKLDELDPGSGDLKKDALVKLNDLKERLQQQQASLGSPDDLKKTLGSLGDLKSENTRELNDSLKKGDFGAAQEALKKVLDRLRDGKMTEAELEKMAKDLREMAREIQKLADEHELQKQQLQEKLKEATQKGDLQEAARIREQLQKKEQLEKQMESLKEMARKLEQCSESMKPGANPGQPKDGSKPGQSGGQPSQASQAALEDLMEQMEQMELDQESLETLQDLEKELQQCKDQMNNCEGQGKPDKPAWKDWARGEGRGGGDRELEETETGEYRSQVKGLIQKGQTVVTGDADGDNVAGASVEQAREQVQASMAKDSDPIEDQQLQRRQRQHALEYFQKLRQGK